jgi:hypothetical protein
MELVNSFMSDFTKLASYLESFAKDDPGYDIACFIKAKISQDLEDITTVNNGDSEELEDNDITMSTPEQRSSSNQEGEEMASAFPEFEVLNKLKEDKEEVRIPGGEDANGNKNVDVSTEEAFGDNVQNQKQASLYTLLKNKIKK